MDPVDLLVEEISTANMLSTKNDDAMDQLVQEIEKVSVLCSEDNYQELVNNNNILQTNSCFSKDYIEYLFAKMKQYYVELNFDETITIFPEYDFEISKLKQLITEFIFSNDPNHKLILTKEFHNCMITTVNAIDCFYS